MPKNKILKKLQSRNISQNHSNTPAQEKQNKNIKELRKLSEQPFRFLCFSGGGAKGAIYSGVHEALESRGVLAGLEAVAGSSAGAITAAFVASGISSESFKKLSQETNLQELLGKGFIINKDGKPLYEIIKNTISDNITSYLDQADITEICRLRLEVIQNELKKIEQNKELEIIELRKELQEQRDRLISIIDSKGDEIHKLNERIKKDKIVYFKDLKLMHIIDPAKFKDLVITATNRSTGELTIFDTQNTPDIEIALACRASASIPIFFKPVKINGKEYVDGGYRDNIPLKYFKNSQENAKNDIEDLTNSTEQVRRAQKNSRTLALAFGSDNMQDQVNIAIYSSKEKIWSPNSIVKFLVNVLFKALSRVGGKFKYTDNVNKTLNQLRDNALNSVALDTKDVSTLSFKKATDRAEYLHVKGYMQTTRHFENHFIEKSQDKNIDIKEFMLDIYEQIQAKNTIGKWTDKIMGGKEKKAAKLLNFCKNETWQKTNPTDNIEEFIATAATKRSDNRLSHNTATMKTIVKTLNDPRTSNIVKQKYIEVLGVDITKTKNYNKEKSMQDNIFNYKFKTADFTKLISKKNVRSKGRR